MNERSRALDAADGGWPARRTAWFTVAMLATALLAAFIDRTAMSLLVTPIKQDLELSDTQMGLLIGAAYGLVNALAAFPAGYVADKFNRRDLVAWGLIVFAFATSLSGLATSFAALFLLRALVGIGEATLHPGATSMIADLFPPERRSRPYGFYLMAAASGIMIVFLIGGPTVAWLTRLGPTEVFGFGPFAPWQRALMVAGLPGLLMGVAILVFVREPRRIDTVRREGRGKDVPIGALLSFGLAHRFPLACLLAGSTLLVMTTYAVLGWVIPWFERGFGWDAARASITFGLTGGLACVIGSPLVGEMADRLKRAGHIDANYLICMFGGLASCVFIMLAGVMSSAILAIVFLALAGLFLTVCPITNAACVNEFAPNAVRARLAAIFNLVIAIGANSLGPLLVGVLNDRVYSGAPATGHSLATVAGVSGGLGFLIMALGRKAYARNLRESQLATALPAKTALPIDPALVP